MGLLPGKTAILRRSAGILLVIPATNNLSRNCHRERQTPSRKHQAYYRFCGRCARDCPQSEPKIHYMVALSRLSTKTLPWKSQKDEC